MRVRRLVVAMLAVVLAVASASAASANTDPPFVKKGSAVEVQILALNDFHGNIQPPAGSSGRVDTDPGTGVTNVDAGGAAFLSTHIANLEQSNRNTIMVSAGDLIGASPLLSSLFHDEPTIEAMNQIGLDLNAVGNHEFDEGTTELLRMQNGGCHPVDGCLDGDGFAGAEFSFLAANVVSEASGETLFPPYSIENFNGAKVAFIGMTLEGTPTIVSPSGVAGYDFLDEADTVNALIAELEQRKVNAIVVLIHEGGLPPTFNYNGCSGISGPIVDIVTRFDDNVDLVISGHTHQPYICTIDGIPTTSSFSFGRLITDIDLSVDRASGDVVGPISINNRIVTRDVAQDQVINDLIAKYSAVAAPIANRVVGHVTADITRTNDDSLEQAMGNAIADAQLFATESPGTGAAVAAFMNPGGVRAAIDFLGSAAGEGNGVVTSGEVFTVQPFGNSLVTMTLTGAQLDSVLEQQFCGPNAALSPPFRVLLPSAGVHYTWSAAATGAPCATANAVTNLTIDGVAVDPALSYRITVNSFLAEGGDGFTALIGGTDRLGGAVDTDAFEDYLASLEPTGLAPPALDRIDRVS